MGRGGAAVITILGAIALHEVAQERYATNNVEGWERYFMFGQETYTASPSAAPTSSLSASSTTENIRTNMAYKGVFIKPSKGGSDGDFYSNFWTDANNAANVGCASEYCPLASVAQDLLASGITDVFIAFKTDGIWSSGRNVGDLAYPSSKYPLNMYPPLQTALDSNSNFDPIKAFMGAIQNAYNKAKQKIHFHAWFPVFYDAHAAQIETQKGSTDLFEVNIPIIGRVGIPNWPTQTCQSNTFAEPTNPAVVEYLLSILSEIYQRYPTLYGINLDYIRYALPADDCVTNSGQKSPYNTWNVNSQAIESFVQSVKTKFPYLVISADVFVTQDNRDSVGQINIPNLISISMPMAYSRLSKEDASDYTEVKDWITAFEGAYKNTTIIPIIKGYPSGINDLMKDVRTDIQDVLSTDVQGCAIFNYESFLIDTHNKKLSSIRDDRGWILF